MISLASRKNLCINKKARDAPGGDAGLNERCRELRTAPASSEKRCEFYPKIDEQGKLLEFRDHALASIRNVEDLEELGKSLNVCPYYGSRRAIKHSEVGTYFAEKLELKHYRYVLCRIISFSPNERESRWAYH